MTTCLACFARVHNFSVDLGGAGSGKIQVDGQI